VRRVLKVRAVKRCVLKVRAVKRCVLKVRAAEQCALEPRVTERCAFKVRTLEISFAKIGAREYIPCEIAAAQDQSMLGAVELLLIVDRLSFEALKFEPSGLRRQ
jgi:hypothetical protein